MKKKALFIIALVCAAVQGAWAQTEVGTAEALTEAISIDGSNKSVKMTADITLSSHLVIENGKNVTLDLNGRTLSRSLSSSTDDGNVIRVEPGGILTVKDGSGNNSGQITGGKATNGGGIVNHGTLTLEGGTITGCFAQDCGGGIFNAPPAGGYPATLTIKGGRVTGNTCNDRGAGIFNYPGCTLNIEGGVYVWDNKKGDDQNNVYLDGETVINVTGALAGSQIGVSIPQGSRTITSGYKTNNTAADGSDFFRCDNSQLGIRQNGDEIDLGTLATFNVRSWDATNKQVVTTPETIICTLIEGTDEYGWMTLTNGYYLVIGKQIFEALTISGDDVHLILADGCKLNCKHIKLEQGNSLHIHSESDGDNKGQLEVVNKYGDYINGAAPIGGGDQKNSGSLYVHGGYVKAWTDDGHGGIGGAGIGGGDKHVIGGEVVIYGGNVSATGHSGAGIGGGSGGSQGGPVTIYGGDVSAESIVGGAGIGGGYQQNGGSVYIYGGNVSATGANFKRYVQVIRKTRYSAGIGGGVDNYVGDLHIYGGTVKPTGGEQSQCVAASVEIANGMKVTTKDGPVLAVDRAQTCYITGRSNDLTIFPCPHDGGFNYIFIDYTTHNRICNYCGLEEEEAHTYDGDNPCVCGKPHDTTADLWSVTMYRATGAASTSYAYHEVMKVVKGQPFTVPAVGATKGLTLMGYTTSWTEGDGIEMKDGETLTTVGAVVTPNADMSYYPRYRYRYVPTWTWNETDATATLTITCSELSSEVISVTDITYTTDEEEGVKTATATYVHNGATYTFTSTYTLPVESLTLLDADSNKEVLDICSGLKVTTLTLSGRTLYKDGKWNTLCLPFGLVLEGSPLKGATVMTLSSASFADGTLTLNFEPATSIEAGKPYIVKWETTGDAIENPVFTNVTISNTLTPVTSHYVDFIGSFSPVPLTANDKTTLYLGADNTLYWPSADMTVGSCRAVFQLKGIEAGELPTQTSRFVLNFGDGETTSLNEELRMKNEEFATAAEWYDMQGRRLSGKPTAKGLYINNGNKVVIK